MSLKVSNWRISSLMAAYNPQALTPMAPATAEATAMMILRMTSQVDFFMMLDF